MSRVPRQKGNVRGRLAALAGLAATAGLTLLHGRLLFQRVADGSLLEPSVAARWVASVLVAGAMLWLWSRGLPLVRGRRAVVLWLVVLLLHLGAPGASLPAITPAAPVLLAVPAAVALVALLGLRPVRGRAARLRRAGTPGAPPPVRPWPTSWPPTLFSRPPPVPLRA